jgi:hypothetical protein
VALSLAAAPPSADPDGSGAWLGLRDGSLVQAAAVEVQNGNVTLKLASGGSLVTTLAGKSEAGKTFWDEVALVQTGSEQVAWLADLAPLGYKHIPFLSVERPFAADRSVLGGRLRSEGNVHLKGLGLPSAARLAYGVAGFRQFEAELALDDSAGIGGSVVYKVLLQGTDGEWRPAYESPALRGGDAPVPISIPLKGAARLALLVEFADRGDALDHANWLSARLIK